MDTSNWITLFSLLIAAFSSFWTLRIDRKWHKEKEEEKKKALIEAKVYEKENRWVINVYNRGLSNARNIRFVSPEIENGEAGIILFDDIQTPYPFLHNGGSFEIGIGVTEEHKPIVIAKFIWDDDLKNNNERDLALNF